MKSVAVRVPKGRLGASAPGDACRVAHGPPACMHPQFLQGIEMTAHAMHERGVPTAVPC